VFHCRRRCRQKQVSEGPASDTMETYPSGASKKRAEQQILMWIKDLGGPEDVEDPL